MGQAERSVSMLYGYDSTGVFSTLRKQLGIKVGKRMRHRINCDVAELQSWEELEGLCSYLSFIFERTE